MKQSAYTLIEVIMVIVGMGILAGAGVPFIQFLLEDLLTMPEQASVRMLVQEALDTIIEGDAQAPGLRLSKQIVAADDSRVTFLDYSNNTIMFSWDSSDKKIYRTANAQKQVIPYYARANDEILSGVDSVFTYYDSTGAVTKNPAAVRRVAVSLMVVEAVKAVPALYKCSSTIAVYAYQ